MQHDFTVATQYGDLLRSQDFMEAMSKVGMSVASLIADDSNRGRSFDAFVKANGIAVKAEDYANGMDYFETNLSAEGDQYAVAQMMRLLMKENNLDAAIKSGVVQTSELSNLGFRSGLLTQKEVDALSRMGASNLATIAALNIR